MSAVGIVTSTDFGSITLDDMYVLPRDSLDGSRLVNVDNAVEFEAVKCTGGPSPYRCVWGKLVNVESERDMYAFQKDQQLTLASASARRFAVRVVEPDVQFVINLHETEKNKDVQTLRIVNMSQRVPAVLCKFLITKNSVTGDSYFSILSPVIGEEGLTIPANSEIKVEIRTETAKQGIYQQSLVIEFNNHKVLRNIRLVCGSSSFIQQYTTDYKNASLLIEPEELLDLFLLTKKKRKLASSGQGSPMTKRRKLSEKWYIPDEVSALLLDKNPPATIRRMFSFVFDPLDRNNYKRKLHYCLYLEELELFRFFQTRSLSNYKLMPVADNPMRFIIECPHLHETRPSLMLHDTVICKLSKKKAYYGAIVELRSDEVVVEMNAEFQKDLHYDVSFHYSRNTFIHQHEGVERITASHRFECLFPRSVVLKTHPVAPILDVEICANDRLAIGGTGYGKRWVQLTRNDLDASQRRVIRNILRGELRALPYLIRGPPGTGKTTTLVEIMLQLMTHDVDARVIVCTQSNSAADLILRKLVQSDKLRKDELVRVIGSFIYSQNLTPPHLLPYCAKFGGEVKETASGAEVDKEKELPKIRTLFNYKDLQNYRIIVTTTGIVPSLVDYGIPSNQFTHLFVDEAGQCLETEILNSLTLMEGERSQVILAGDDRQLGPVVMCNDLESTEFSESLFERLMKCPLYDNTAEECNNVLSNQLNYNYRSIPTILGLFNGLFYNSQLKAMVMEGKKYELLEKLQVVLPKNAQRRPTMGVIFFDVLGVQQRSECSPSWLNPAEAHLVIHLVEEMLKTGVEQDDIGIITPYQGQVRYIRQQMVERGLNTKIGSVEQFQGQERPIIILSAVRSSTEPFDYTEMTSMGFVSSRKRLNVAISRAQSLLVIVGNPIMLERDQNWRKTIEYCTHRGAYVTTEKELLELLREILEESKLSGGSSPVINSRSFS